VQDKIPKECNFVNLQLCWECCVIYLVHTVDVIAIATIITRFKILKKFAISDLHITVDFLRTRPCNYAHQKTKLFFLLRTLPKYLNKKK